MDKKFSVIFAVLVAMASSACAKYSLTTLAQPNVGAGTDVWQVRPVVTLPVFKIYQSNRSNSIVDVQTLASAGGGISIGKYSTDSDGVVSTPFSISPLVLLAGDTANTTATLNMALALTLNFFNNTVQIGGGYDLGDTTGRPSRGFGLLSVAFASGAQPKK